MSANRHTRYWFGRLRARARRRPAPRVAILGAGFGGLAVAVELRRAGIDTFTIFEAADGVGGTWRHNTYPGAACDVPSHLYSFSFALNKKWSRTFARQPEILAYLEDVADRFGLRPFLTTGTAVTRIEWEEDSQQWTLTTADGARHVFDVVVSALGLFAQPRMPDIAGLESFGGPVVHTARWQHDVTWAGRRVAVIGTGASAIQLVPELAAKARQLMVFQRTPPWMLPKEDRLYTPAELKRFARVPWAARRERWRRLREQHVNTVVRTDDPRTSERQQMAYGYLSHKVSDPALRSALTPDYPFGCKRVLLGSSYYSALTRDDVHLVTAPISRMGTDAVLTADGMRHQCDAVVVATGFEATNYLAGLEVIGVGGRKLHDDWAAGAYAYLGVAVSGYPNFFMIYGPNTNQGGASIVLILEAAARLVRNAVTYLAHHRGALEIRADVLEQFNADLQADLSGSVWNQCASYFRARDGRIVTQWPHTGLDYARRTWRLNPRDWRHRPSKNPR
jgi:cation diffusion facilitator CzcD-associated flavoprotein CzcO